MLVKGMRVLANGLRTDHPIPGLPFVEDGHIPVEDADKVEAVGRGVEEGMWGRTDPMFTHTGHGTERDSTEAGWKAFTTDPIRKDLAWLVRWHPEHGRSVWLTSDDDVVGIYSYLEDETVLWRAGGYWLGNDGAWYRPSAIFDYALEEYVTRAVPGAGHVTAADVLGGQAVPALKPREASSKVLSVHGIDPEQPRTLSSVEWNQQLLLWAGNRTPGTSAAEKLAARPLERCIVDIAAPELNAGQMLNASEMAAAAGISVATLRGYISRGENDVPDPQAVLGASSVWSRPVVEQWIEARGYTTEAAEEAVSTRGFGGIDMPAGLVDAAEQISYWLQADLASPGPDLGPSLLRWRKRRDRTSTTNLAKGLGLAVASNLIRLIPMQHLTVTLTAAILGDMAQHAAIDRKLAQDDPNDDGAVYHSMVLATERMLVWLVRCSPVHARAVINNVIGEALRNPDLYHADREGLMFMFRQGLNMSRSSKHGLTADQVSAFLATIAGA